MGKLPIDQHDIDLISGQEEDRVFAEKLRAERHWGEVKEQPFQLRRERAEVEARLARNPGLLPTIASLTSHEQRNYSLLRLVDNLARHFQGRPEGCLETEIASSISSDLKGKGTPGFFVPMQLRPQASGLDTKTDSAGRYLVGERVGDVIDYLQDEMVVGRLGAQVVSGIRQPLAFPVESTPTIASWASENPGADAAESDPSFAFSASKARTLIATTSFTRELLLQSSQRVEIWLRRKLANSLALALDRAAVRGTGDSNQPTGILYTDGVWEQIAGDPNGAAIDAGDIVALEGKLGKANAGSRLALLTNATQREKMRALPRLTNGTEAALWSDDNRVLGYAAAVSNQVPDDLVKGGSSDCSAIILADFSRLLLLEFQGAVSIEVDPYSKKKQGLIEVTVYGMFDILLEQPAAFGRIVDAR